MIGSSRLAKSRIRRVTRIGGFGSVGCDCVYDNVNREFVSFTFNNTSPTKTLFFETTDALGNTYTDTWAPGQSKTFTPPVRPKMTQFTASHTGKVYYNFLHKITYR